MSFTRRQCVVKFTGTREISHAEAIQPLERHWFALVADQHLRLQLLGIHFAGSITSGTNSPLREGCLVAFWGSRALQFLVESAPVPLDPLNWSRSGGVARASAMEVRCRRH